MKIGIGTYSFGGMASFLGLGPTLLEKFQTIASLGFKTVELLAADLADNDVEDIKKWLAETGLEAVSVHAEPTEEVVKKMAALGGKAVIWPMTAMANKAEAIEVAKILDEMAEMAAPYGIKVAYHNHSPEFFVDEGKALLEHMIENSSKCYFQLDCGWAMNGGHYPPSFLRRYPGRFISIHVKENSKVHGPGERPRSRHAEVEQHGGPFDNIKELPREERQKMLDEMEARMAAMAKDRPIVQCPIGAPESNIDWVEIKKALDETSPEAFWIVEREEFYGDHDQCIADDCKWLVENVK